MKLKAFIVIALAIVAIQRVNAQAKSYNVHTVAFYNFENLFDTIDNPKIDE